MIRFHLVSIIAGNERYLVTARRKPRGYIVQKTETRKVFKVTSHYEASLDWETIKGWRPVGLNGYIGRVYWTKKEAAHALVSDNKFIRAYGFEDHIPL